MLKTTRNKKEKHNKIVMLARSKSNSIESTEALVCKETNHEDFIMIINEEKNYQELKESIRMMNNQRRDAEKNYCIEEGKNIGIDEIIKRNKINNKNLKSQM